MKKGKILYLFPLSALFISGCSFAEVKHSIGESWVGEHILHPVYDPIRDFVNGEKNENPGGKQDEPVTPAHTHTFSELHARVAPTCTSEGSAAYYTCSGCDKIFDENKEEISQVQILPALGHAPHHHEGTPANCTESGTGEYWTCDNACDNKMYSDAECKNVISSAPVVEALGHKLEAKPGKAASCTEVGYNSYYECSDCHDLFEDEAGKKAIADLEVWKTDAGKVEMTAHTIVPVAGKQASCTEDGFESYYQCSVCNKYFEDEDAESEITDLAVWKDGDGKIPMGEHGYGTPTVEWSGSSATATAQCTGCTAKISETKVGTFVEDTAATCHSAQLGHYEVTFDDTRLGSASTDANSVTGSAATGNHVYDYASKQVSWDGAKATVTAPCSTPGCTAVVSEEKTGSFVKDTNSTCTAPEKGHYEVTFDNTNFGSASSTANSVENGEPHAHSLGDLIPQTNRHRDQNGMKAHYVCAECGGLFDEEEKLCTADDLKIENTFGTFNPDEDASYVFDSPLAAGSKVVFDFKINEEADTYINFCLMDNTWANHTEYITVYAGGNCKVLPGVTVGQVLEDGYIRVAVDTAVVPCEGTLEQIDFMYIRSATSNATGSFEYDPIGGTVALGEKFAPGSYQYKLRDEVNLFGTVSTFDISFITEGYVNFRFEELNWGKASKYIKLSSDGLLSDFRAGVKVERIMDVPEGLVSCFRVTIDFNQIDKWSETPLTSIGRLTIHPDITATGTIDINNPEEYALNSSVVVTPGNEYFFDKAYGVEDYLGLSFEYKMTDADAVSRVMLEDNDSYIGDFGLKSTGLDQTYAGLTTEALGDGFIKVTVIYGNVTRCGASWSTSVAAKGIEAVHSIKVHGSWGTPGNVEIRNVQGLKEVELPNRGDKYTFLNPLDLSVCRKLSFDFKVEGNTDLEATKIMLNANTGYVGDYGLTRVGLQDSYQGVTCESLGDGFFHVTFEFSKVDRANASWFSKLGWSSLSDGGITKITSIQTHSSWGQGCPLTIKNISVENSSRDARTFTTSDYVDLPVKYTADQVFGKALTFEYKLESGGTHSDYAHIVMMNTGWKNISGEIDLFGDATCNKGSVEALGDGWFKVTVDTNRFNGDGNVRDGITNFRLEKFGGTATSLTIDWETLRLVDYDREFTRSVGGVVAKFEQPLANWKSSGKQITIDLTGTTPQGGGKFVFGLRNSSNQTVAKFTVDFNAKTSDAVLYKGNKGTLITGGEIIDGKHFTVTVDLSLLDAESDFNGSETIVDMNCSEIWYDAMIHSINLSNK